MSAQVYLYSLTVGRCAEDLSIQPPCILFPSMLTLLTVVQGLYVLPSVGDGPNFSYRESIFCSKISSGESLFIEKLVLGGTNFWGAHF